MKATILIETHTMPAYRAIRPAIVAAKVGYIGVSGLTLPPSKGVPEGRGIKTPPTNLIFRLDFDCRNCLMYVSATEQQRTTTPSSRP